MAQPGNFTPILLYGSSTPTNVPLAANLTNSATGSEIAINVADKNLFFKDSGGVVNTVPIRQSSTSSNGWLSATDWNTFNGKAPATSGTSILYGNGSGGFSNVTIGSGISFAGGTLSATGTGGTVTSVAALTIGTTGTDLSSTVANGTTTPVITLQVPTASATNRGALSSTDWSTFNGKQAALVSGTNIKTVGGVTLLGSGDVGTIGVGYGGTGTSTAFTAGSVVFAGASGVYSQSNANLFWDNTNKRLGINIATPSSILDVRTNLSATTGVQNIAEFYPVTSGSTNSGYGGSIRILTKNANGNYWPVAIAALNSGAGSNLSDLGFYTATSGPTLNERMRIFSTGGVSIGNTTDPGAGNLSVTGSIKASQTAGYIGTTTNNDASAGSIGEYISSTVASGSAIALTTGVFANVTSISLTAGDWDVDGVIGFSETSGLASFIYFNGSSSTTSAAAGPLGTSYFLSYSTANAIAHYVNAEQPIPTYRYSVSGTTTVYLTIRGSFTGGTVGGYGTIRARRVR